MTIFFEKINNNLLLRYEPAFGNEEILQKLKNGETMRIKNTFTITRDNLFSKNDIQNFEEILEFNIGRDDGEYIEIDSEIIGTRHRFFFANDINFTQNLFVAYQNISVLGKIDDLIDHDFYVGGNWEKRNGIPIDAYMELIKMFPNTTELKKYAHRRIAVILKEFFPECDQYEAVFNRYIRDKHMQKNISSDELEEVYSTQIKLAQFSVVINELEEMLRNSEAIEEKRWQRKIHRILCHLYPRYILCEPEIKFSGYGKNDKQPDFLLVDTNGFVDILEIKKANVRVLTKYRNNYVASREVSGAIQQIEKYIFCLNTSEKAKKDVIKKLEPKLPKGMKLQIINPQGLLLFGRSNYFNTDEKQDFELLKRQYKHIADIMTYDDLLQRLKNIQTSLQLQIESEKKNIKKYEMRKEI